MRGTLARHAEVIWSGHEAFTEKMQPHAVHDHTSGERVLRVGEPLCQFQPAALLHIGQSAAATGAQKTAWDGGTQFLRLAVDVQFAIFDLFGLAHPHGQRHFGCVFEAGLRGRAVRRVGLDNRLHLGASRDFGRSL